MKSIIISLIVLIYSFSVFPKEDPYYFKLYFGNSTNLKVEELKIGVGELINWNSCFSETSKLLNRNDNCENLENKNNNYDGSVQVCMNSSGNIELNNQLCEEKEPYCGSDNGNILNNLPQNLCSFGNGVLLNETSDLYNWKCTNETKEILCSAEKYKEPTSYCYYDSNNKVSVAFGYGGIMSTNLFYYNQNGNGFFYDEGNKSYAVERLVYSSFGTFSGVGPIYVANNFWRGALRKNQIDPVNYTSSIIEYEICRKNPLPVRELEMVKTCYFDRTSRYVRYNTSVGDYTVQFDGFSARTGTGTVVSNGKTYSLKEGSTGYTNMYKVCETKLQ